MANNCCDSSIDGTTATDVTLVNPTIIGGTSVNTDIGADCAGNRVLTGVTTFATCADLANLGNTYIAAQNGTGVNTTLTNPTINGGTLNGVQIAQECDGTPILAGAVLATCQDLQQGLADTLSDANAYTDAQVVGLQPRLLNCTGVALAANTQVATCVDLTNATKGFLAGVTTLDSTTIDFSGNGSIATPLTAVAKVSAQVGNAISIVGDGLFAADTTGLTSVAHDATLTGLGTVGSPLSVVPPAAGSVAVISDGTTITGNGTVGNPLVAVTAATNVIHNATLTGNGSVGSPLGVVAGTVPVTVDGVTVTGNGTTGNPLVAVTNVIHDATLTGNGTVGTPLGVITAPAVQPASNNAASLPTPMIGNRTLILGEPAGWDEFPVGSGRLRPYWN